MATIPPSEGYESLHDSSHHTKGEANKEIDIYNQRSSSKRRNIYSKVTAPFISRSVRAKRRRAFLNTYTLSTLQSSPSATTTYQTKSQKTLRQTTEKLKSAMSSLMQAARKNYLQGCLSRPAIRPSSSYPASPITTY